MTKLWVPSPAKFPAFRMLCVGAMFYIGYHTLGHRFRTEFMRRVRARNELMRLDVATIKELVDVDLRTKDGSKLKLDDLKSEYICIYTGSFKDFARIHTSLLETAYNPELGFLFVSDQEKLQRIQTEAIRVPLSNS